MHRDTLELQTNVEEWGGILSAHKPLEVRMSPSC